MFARMATYEMGKQALGFCFQLRGEGLVLSNLYIYRLKMQLENNEYNAHGSIGSMQLTHTVLRLTTIACGHKHNNIFNIESLMHVH